MNVVSVLHYEFVGLRHDEQALPDLPLSRRLSGLQLATLVALARWQDGRPHDAAMLLQERRAPVFSATHFGELDTLLGLQRSLYDEALPVSPTAFQNALPSAAGGYAAIVHKLTQPQVVFASGHLSCDAMLLWAYHKIMTGTEAVVCLNGTERLTNHEEHRAEVELIVLGGASIGEGGWRLNRMRHIVNAKQEGSYGDGAIIDDERAGRIAQLRLDQALGKVYKRMVRSSDGEGIASDWSLES